MYGPVERKNLHIYFQRGLNWDKWDNIAEYVALDDMDWHESIYVNLSIRGFGVSMVKEGKACIYVCNELDVWNRLILLLI